MSKTGLTVNDALKQAWTLHQAGNLAQAEQIYRRIIAAKPNNFDAPSLLGLLHYQSKRYKEADRFLKLALAIKPREPVALCTRGAVLSALRKFEDALACFDRAISAKSDD